MWHSSYSFHSLLPVLCLMISQLRDSLNLRSNIHSFGGRGTSWQCPSSNVTKLATGEHATFMQVTMRVCFYMHYNDGDPCPLITVETSIIQILKPKPLYSSGLMSKNELRPGEADRARVMMGSCLGQRSLVVAANSVEQAMAQEHRQRYQGVSWHS